MRNEKSGKSKKSKFPTKISSFQNLKIYLTRKKIIAPTVQKTGGKTEKIEEETTQKSAAKADISNVLGKFKKTNKKNVVPTIPKAALITDILAIFELEKGNFIPTNFSKYLKKMRKTMLKNLFEILTENQTAKKKKSDFQP